MAHYDFKVEEMPAQKVISIRTRTPVDKLPEVIGRAYMAIMSYLGEMGEQPSGAPYTAYYNMDMQDLDVEMGFPVRQPLPGKNDLNPSEIPAGKQVSCMYKGPYSKMEECYKALTDFTCENNLIPLGISYEFYFTGPETAEEEHLTRVMFLVK